MRYLLERLEEVRQGPPLRATLGPGVSVGSSQPWEPASDTDLTDKLVKLLTKSVGGGLSRPPPEVSSLTKANRHNAARGIKKKRGEYRGRRGKPVPDSGVVYDVNAQSSGNRVTVDMYDDEYGFEAGTVSAQKVDPDYTRCLADIKDMVKDGYGPWGMRRTKWKHTKVYELKSSELDKAFRGTEGKIGKQAYLMLVTALKKRNPHGFFFVSNSCGTGSTSGLASRVWASLARRYPSRRGRTGTVLWIGPKPWSYRRKPKNEPGGESRR